MVETYHYSMTITSRRAPVATHNKDDNDHAEVARKYLAGDQ